jgi:hypothetical protein
MSRDNSNNDIFVFADSVKILTGKTEEERKTDMLLKVYYFIKNKCWYNRIYNLNSFWAEGDLNRKRFVNCVKELINTNSFGKNEVEFNNNYSCFRKRDDFDFRDKGIKEYNVGGMS